MASGREEIQTNSRTPAEPAEIIHLRGTGSAAERGRLGASYFHFAQYYGAAADGTHVAMTGAPPATEAEPTHAVLDAHQISGHRRSVKKQSTIKPFDFRRPSKFSRDHFRAFQIVHETFARQVSTVLSTTLRTLSVVTLSEIEQMSYGEYIESLPNPSFLTIFQMNPLPGASLFWIPLPLVMASVERLLGGAGAAEGNDYQPRQLTEIESNLMRDLTERCLRELTYAHESLFPVEAHVAQVESNPQFAQVAAATDMMLVVSYDMKIGSEEGKATLCIPFSSLAPGLETFTANHFNEKPTEDLSGIREALKTRLAEVPVTVTVEFEEISLTSRDIVDLQVGDVIPLSHNMKAPLSVKAEGHTNLYAMPGRRGKRLAVQIVDHYEGNA